MSEREKLEQEWQRPGVRQTRHVAQWHRPEEMTSETVSRAKEPERRRAENGELFTTPGKLLNPVNKK